MSSYRPSYGAPPPPPPPLQMPPLPPGPPPSYDPHGDSWRPSRASGYSLPQSDFSFQVQKPAPQYPRGYDGHRPIQNSHRPPDGNTQRHKRDVRRGGRSFRGRGAKLMPSDRPLLQQRGGGDYNEQILGVDPNTQKFIPVDDISVSEEEDTGEPNSNQEADEDRNDRENNLDQEPPAKRRAVTSDGAADGNGLPKWSNPDPYSVLPPTDEVHRKRKDPVAFIRKAYKPAEGKAVAHSQVAANDDFISFDDDAEESKLRSPSSHSKSRASPEHIVWDNGDQAYATDLNADDDPFLGSRKRTHNDEIKPMGQALKASSVHPNGSLLEAWLPRTANDVAPWLNRDTAGVISPGFRLHREICDFFEFVKPRHHEQIVRQALLSRLQDLVSRELSDCTVHCFGSFAAGLYLPNADMDIVINSNTFRSTGDRVICQSKNKLHKFGQFLRSSRIAQEGSVDVIASAKVPIIKFVDHITAIKVDVSFENDTGLVANETFAGWKRQYPAMPLLVAIIKQFLMMRGLNEVQFGGLGGFSVTCLVVSLLQNMPRIQDGSLTPEQNLGEVLIEFLDFYGNRIDTSRTGISMNPPGYFDKQAMDRLSFRGPVYNPNKSDRLAIMDPNRPGNDISGGSKKVALIFDRFSRAHAELLKAMREQNRPSLLDWLLGGNYEPFAWHRAHLLEIFNKDSPRPKATEHHSQGDRVVGPLQPKLHPHITFDKPRERAYSMKRKYPGVLGGMTPDTLSKHERKALEAIFVEVGIFLVNGPLEILIPLQDRQREEIICSLKGASMDKLIEVD